MAKRGLLAFVAVIFSVGSLDAYRLALRDGTVIKFVAYRTTETTLFYTDDKNHENSIPLTSVDLVQTQELNANERPPLILPGMKAEPAGPGADSSVSLADAARKVSRKPDSVAKHRFTDDDVRHYDGNSGGLTASIPTSTESASVAFDEAEKFANLLGGKTDRELGEMEVGDVRFPSRDNWEAKLVSQRDKLVKATLAAVDAGRRSLQIWSAKASETTLTAEERFQLQEAQNAVKNQISDIRAERHRFDALVSEGVKAASQWGRATNK